MNDRAEAIPPHYQKAKLLTLWVDRRMLMVILGVWELVKIFDADFDAEIPLLPIRNSAVRYVPR